MNYIKQIVKRTLLFILMVTSFVNINAQNCFENLGEVSGIKISQFSSELNTSACELIETLPVEYHSQFKVFDFGFYSLEGSMDSDINELWTDVIAKAQSKSPYYLLIGKVSGVAGIYSEFFVDLKLPPIFDAECADIVTRKIAEIKNILNSEPNALDFVQKEKDAMASLHDVGNCEICDDEVDNDGDGHIDCADFDCLYLQISSQLKGGKEASDSRDDCIVLTPEQLDIFTEYEDDIVSIGYESSAEVLLEIEALGFAKCFTGAIVSAFVDYTLYWAELNLTNDKYYKFLSTETAKTIFHLHGYAITLNASTSCVESCIPFVKNRIKELIKDFALGFLEGFIEAAEAEYIIHSNNWCTLQEILTEEMDWPGIFEKAGTAAIGNVIVGQLGSQIKPIITTAYSNNKAKVIDRIRSGIGQDVWVKIKTWFNLNGADAFESVLAQLRPHFTFIDGKSTKWDGFISDFGNSITDLKWFLTDITNKINAWKIADDFKFPSSKIDFLKALNKRITNSDFPFSESIIEDLIVKAEILDEVIGSSEVKDLLIDLIGNEKFINHEDLVKNIDACFVNGIPNTSKLNSQLNEFFEGQYWLTRGEKVKISKELNPGQQFNNEVDGLMLTSKGILECKYPNVPGPNAQNNVFANLGLIIKKFTTESKLTQYWKDIYPKRYGQINIANGSFTNLTTASEFVDAVYNAGIIGNEAGVSLFTLAELQSLDELHIIVDNIRFVISPQDWY